MQFSSLEEIVYAVFFLIPGFIVVEIENKIIPGKKRTEFERVLLFLGRSILHLGLWFWLYRIIDSTFKKYTPGYWLLLILLVIITGTITGTAIGVLKKIDIIKVICSKLKIQVEHPIPTAWEYKFSQLSNGCYLTVALENGSFLRGAFYNKSLASSDLNDLDIFIEEAYMLGEDGKWKRVKGTDGIWIPVNSIMWISFFKEEIIDG